ncbi:SDR family NAD(P)-dependent oxidoreductase [Flexivirga caeni]|uniref:SDR family NAD(P)-dependent oxidoreductase n=2 Tax=Flexivirga caeni TaxID=2294115 RepID=A0A3M9M6T8_9MICO|nr:SDR family NAD(P)-dependent oxidoreductase [Flexivirga caeni]
MKHVVPWLRDAGGQIVLVSSRLGLVGVPNEVMYTAAKGGLIMRGKGAAVELAARNIRVNVAAPGLTEAATLEAGIRRRSDPDGWLCQAKLAPP